MLRMTKQTDYGIVLMTHFAGEPEAQHSAPELAAALAIPLPMVSKILKLLARDGLLLSHRGVRGGYTLARAPAAISVASVVAALEGPIAMTECVDEGHGQGHDCLREPICAVRTHWQVINRVVFEALENISLAAMTRPAGPADLVRLGGHRTVASAARSGPLAGRIEGGAS
jgi:FeS assembly SUF system regulator